MYIYVYKLLKTCLRDKNGRGNLYAAYSCIEYMVKFIYPLELTMFVAL